MLLGLEGVEQAEADFGAETNDASALERQSRAHKRRMNRAALPAHLPGVMSTHPTAKTERPIARLKGFKGILQVDGYAGYPKLAEGGRRPAGVLLVACPA
jgi:hypothetical protein